MNLTVAEAKTLLASILRAAPSLTASLSEAAIVVFPPFTALPAAARLLLDTPVRLGAQNLFWENQGAYTGEISGPMLADAGCCYVLVGHSERRGHFGETDAVVSKKILAALGAGLQPILCIGETLEEREAGQTVRIIARQIQGSLEGLPADRFRDVLIAYEPVWAIGTGKTASPAQAEEIHAFIRGTLEEKYGNEAASCAIILYGGSVKPANSYSLFKEKDIDGFLVGGASLEAESFILIVKEAIKAYKEEH